ncbi:hypothetical protein DNTS_003963 [Danionella cerebrum]|uniref:Ig-like domain-containing protein n=1 Tax=Danionella cerebrum TaxID=2873325 RepID=A0A553Q1D9_9TELE|nr:hypothetical protein DNTS_003963 [Danionella translucida]
MWRHGVIYISAAVLFVTLTGSNATCPIEIRPPTLVVSVGEMQKISENISRWSIAELKDWDFDPPFCFLNYEDQCEDNLNVIVHKTPESVSISTVKDIGAMIEGNQYKLQCDVHNVAPARSVTVKWYKEQTLLYQTNFTDAQKTPVSQISKFMIHPNRTDDGTRIWCEAEMNLGEAGPQPPPKVKSEPFRVAVYYPPKQSSVLENIDTCDDVVLNCTVRSNPSPDYTWHSDHLTEKISSSVLQASSLSSGNYTCTASNIMGENIKVFIVTCTGRTTFWALVFSGVGVAVVLIISYVVYKIRSPPNSVI